VSIPTSRSARGSGGAAEFSICRKNMTQYEAPSRFCWVRSFATVLLVGGVLATAFNTFSLRPHPMTGRSPVVAGPRSSALPISEPYRIEVTGNDHRWEVRYPGAVRTGRSGHVPVATHVIFVLKSKDYVYTLGIPQYGLKEIAVPDLEFQMEFRPSAAGRFSLLGQELCGDPDGDFQGQLIVEPRDQFARWLLAPGSDAAD